MSAYECPRCSYKTDRKGDFKKHVTRRRLCEPTKSEDDLSRVRASLEDAPTGKKFDCERCGKSFASKSGRSNHEKKCDVTKKNEHERRIFDKLDRILTVLEKILEAVSEKEDPLPFGREDASHLTQQDHNSFVRKANAEALCEYVARIWKSQDRPKNHNFRIIDEKRVEIYERGSWRFVSPTVAVNSIIAKAGEHLSSAFADREPSPREAYVFAHKIAKPLKWNALSEPYPDLANADYGSARKALSTSLRRALFET